MDALQQIYCPSTKLFSHIIIHLGNDYSAALHTVDTTTELDINSVSTESHN